MKEKKNKNDQLKMYIFNINSFSYYFQKVLFQMNEPFKFIYQFHIFKYICIFD